MKPVTVFTHVSGLGWRALFGAALLGVLSSVFAPAHADETEIFRSSIDVTGSRPKVLIIFDNSRSMTTIAEDKPAYNPNITYTTVSGIQAGRLYWSSSSNGNPPATNTSQWFNEAKNRCASSYTPLANQGVFTSTWIRWATSSSTSWTVGFSTNSADRDPTHVDCKADHDNSVVGNGSGTGSPGDGYPRRSTPRPYGATRETPVSSWGSTTVRVYSANFMNWYYSTTVVERSRLEVAQSVVTNIINGNPGIDFGLAVFNTNDDSSSDGGRIVRRIISDSTASQRTDLVNMIDGLGTDLYTPLCETMYEAYLYLSGKPVRYRAEAGSSQPPRDANAENGSNRYVAPASDCQYVYVIFMTDGAPTNDLDANSLIKTLTGKTCKTNTYRTDPLVGGGYVENCLPELTEYMYTQDLDGNPDNGVQKAITYTIGFTTDQTLLSDAAAKGGGQYFTANNTAELTSAFQGAISNILSTSSSFTSPAVAVDSFSRTQSLDSVFLAMFLPKTSTDWPGNIKKFKVTVNSSGVASYVDANNVAALDTTTGHLKSTAKSFWSADVDGPDVMKGGVGELLAARDPDTREIKFNSGAGNLLDLTPTNVTATNFGVADDAALFNAFSVANQSELTRLVEWIRGWESKSTSVKRTWMIGDILNSRPVAINYGARSGFTTSNPDLRLLVGTNGGLLHMFQGDSDTGSGSESWAFMPKELAAIHAVRREDAESSSNVYGVDAPPVIYRLDANNDGTISSSGTDKVYAFVGLRRGGRGMYALDITNPDSPAFLWKIDNNTAGFSELGQTWSTPTVTKIKGHANPVLIMGAGYDASYDDKTTQAGSSTASMGRGVFFVDAVTGALLWSATPGTASAKNKQVAAFARAMPSPPTVMDSNGDGYADRVYIPDVAGNVWRIDLAGTAIPSTDHTAWRVLQLASLAESNHAGDRRFFNAIEVARALESSKPFDALLLGSGDRSNPNATDNSDRFYMIRDYMTGVYTTNPPTKPCAVPTSDPRCVLPVTNSLLYNASDNLIQVGSTAEKVAAKNALGTAAGWYVNLTAATGEKSLATSRTIAGTVYFTTFSPGGAVLVANSCEPASGTGRLYAVSIFDASAKLDFNDNNSLTLSDRSVVTGSMISDTPSIYSGSDRVIQLILPPGSVPTTGTIFRQGSQSTGRRLGLQTKVPFVNTETYAPGQDAGRYWYMPDRR